MSFPDGLNATPSGRLSFAARPAMALTGIADPEMRAHMRGYGKRRRAFRSRDRQRGDIDSGASTFSARKTPLVEFFLRDSTGGRRTGFRPDRA